MASPKHFSDGQFTLKEVVQGLIDWVGYLISNWKFFMLFGALGMGAGALVSVFKKPIFHAQTSFVLEEGSGGGMGQMSGLASLVGVNLGSLGSESGLFQGDNIMELYRSDRMIGETLLSSFDESHLLIDRFVEFEELEEKWKNKVDIFSMDFSIPRQDFTISQDSVIKEVSKLIREKQLAVEKPDRKLTILSVMISSKDEFFAKVFNERLVEKVNAFYQETKTKKTGENLAILQSQADSVKAILNESIGSYASLTDRVPNVNPLLSSAKVQSRQRQVDVEATGSIYSEIVKNLEIAKVNHRNNSPLIQIIDSPRLPLSRTEIRLFKGMVLGALLGAFLALVILYFGRLYQKHGQEG
jgi:hypothetical protein